MSKPSRKELIALIAEAEELIRIANTANYALRLEGAGSDCTLKHEVRMFALDYSREGRDGPGALQVRGTGRSWKWIEKAIEAQDRMSGYMPPRR